MNPESKLRDMRRIFNTGWLETARKFSGWALDAEDVIFYADITFMPCLTGWNPMDLRAKMLI